MNKNYKRRKNNAAVLELTELGSIVIGIVIVMCLVFLALGGLDLIGGLLRWGTTAFLAAQWLGR